MVTPSPVLYVGWCAEMPGNSGRVWCRTCRCGLIASLNTLVVHSQSCKHQHNADQPPQSPPPADEQYSSVHEVSEAGHSGYAPSPDGVGDDGGAADDDDDRAASPVIESDFAVRRNRDGGGTAVFQIHSFTHVDSSSLVIFVLSRISKGFHTRIEVRYMFASAGHITDLVVVNSQQIVYVTAGHKSAMSNGQCYCLVGFIKARRNCVKPEINSCFSFTHLGEVHTGLHIIRYIE